LLNFDFLTNTTFTTNTTLTTNQKTMFDKLIEAQQKAGEVKKRLDGITVSGTAEGGKITVTANGNKVIQSISIDEDFYKDADKEELEELLVVAINKAIAQAENVSQSEMAALTKDMFGGLGNMFGK
jgi:DNA-binding YbaB/EbfC family protein